MDLSMRKVRPRVNPISEHITSVSIDDTLNAYTREQLTSALERQKVLDPTFGSAVAELQAQWLTDLERHLSTITSNIMTLVARLMEEVRTGRVVNEKERISIPLQVNELIAISKELRQCMNDMAEQYRTSLGLPSHVTGHLHAMSGYGGLSDEELDRRIAHLSRHLNFRSLPGSPERAGKDGR